MINTMQKKPKNRTRVLLVSHEGMLLVFGYYYEGRFQEDNSSEWKNPSEYEGWVSMEVLRAKIGIKE